MSQSAPIRVLLIGRALTFKVIESCLNRHQMLHYTCVEDLAAAEALIARGFEAELIVAQADLYTSSAEADSWLADDRHGLLLVLPMACDLAVLERRLRVLLDICLLRRLGAGHQAHAARPPSEFQNSRRIAS